MTNFINPIFFVNNKMSSRLRTFVCELALVDSDIYIYGSNNDIETCIGPGNGKHIFTKFKGNIYFLICLNVICYTCCFGDQHNLCIDCFMKELTIPKSF
jgi:hypothetical protein